MPVRKYRRSASEISCCLKYVIFSVNVLFWVSAQTMELYELSFSIQIDNIALYKCFMFSIANFRF